MQTRAVAATLVLTLLLLATAHGRPPVRIMPFGDSITVFDCRLNAYTSADDRPVFQPLESLPAFSCVESAEASPLSAGQTLQ